MDIYLETSSTTISWNWEIFSKDIMRNLLMKIKNCAEEFDRELSSESVSPAGVWLDEVAFNQNVGGEWLRLGRKRIWLMYRVKSSDYDWPNGHNEVYGKESLDMPPPYQQRCIWHRQDL